MSGAPRICWRALLSALARESRAARGRLLFFTACLAIGVAAVVGVSALVAAMRAGLLSESRDLLAADLRVSARRPLPESLDTFFADVPHRRSEVRELAAMASRETDSNDMRGSVLVELKVVDGEYPFYGQLELAPAMSVAELGPDAAFVGPDLLASLGLEVGDDVLIGGVSYRIAAEILDEPDRLEFAMTLGPRVFLSADGLARTELIDTKSRVRYRALFRLDENLDREELAQLADELRGALRDASYVSIRTHTDAQPNVRRSLSRVEEYLGLIALLSLLLGGIGVSQIVSAWLRGRAQSVAVMRSLGFRASEIAGLYLGHVGLLALAGCFVGGLVGAALPWVVAGWAPDLLERDTALLWQPLSVARGVGLGLVVALLFSLPPLTAVWRVPPAAVLRAEAVPLDAPRAIRIGAPIALFLGVFASAWVQSGGVRIAALFSVGLIVLAGLLYVGARVVTALPSWLPRGRFGPYFEHGLAALARPGSGTTPAIVALGIGVMVVVSMLLIEQQLEATLRDALPVDAPSVFLVDVQPDQWDGVRDTIVEHGGQSVDSVPVVMARLREIGGRPVNEITAERRDKGRAAWVFTREQRLTWMNELPEDNVLIEGELWSDADRDEVSIEEEFARDLGVGIGETLRLDVQGVVVDLLVTSLRTVDWQSFGINFFLVVEPGVLEAAPHSRIAAARLEPADAEHALQNEIASEYPNVTMIRIRPILEKIAAVLERIAFGVRALGSFAFVAGLVILAGAVGTTALRRAREAALLKALGVTRGGVTRLFAVEYALTGLVAGTIGSVGALGLTWGFLEQVLEIDARLSFVAIPLAAAAAAGLATLSGLAASARALRARPIETLRG